MQDYGSQTDAGVAGDLKYWVWVMIPPPFVTIQWVYYYNKLLARSNIIQEIGPPVRDI